MFKNNPEKSSCGGGCLGPGGQSHLPQQPEPRPTAPGYFTHTPPRTSRQPFFVQALEPGGKRSRFPRLCTPFSWWVTKPNTLNQNLPSPLFPGPDKELVRCPEPERQKSGCAAGLFLPSGYTTPSVDLAVAQPWDTCERREKPSPYFLTDRFALGRYFYVLCLVGFFF